MTENVLEISVLWQLCIRLIYGMAFVGCAIRKQYQRKSKNILFKIIIFNINFYLIFIIFFIIYILSYTRPLPLNITLTKSYLIAPSSGQG